MTLDLLSVGEAMAELRQGPDGGFRVGFAGDSFNTALYCARELGEAGRVGYCTRIGCDPLSDAFLAMAVAEGIDMSHTARDPDRHIGIYTVSTDAAGERGFHYWRADSAARRLFAAGPAAGLPPARILYLSAITLAILDPPARRRLIDGLVECRAREGCLIAFDSNHRPQLWEDAATARRTVADLWEIANIALPSADDEMALFGDKCEAAVIARFGARAWTACAVKRGARGPVSPDLARAAHPDFPPAATVVDTTAAGDSFNGAYLAAWLRGEGEAQCLLRGHETARRVVGVAGAIAPRA